MPRRTVALISVIVGGIVALAGCGTSEPLTGSVAVRGSRNVLPIVSAYAGGFAEEHPYVRFDVAMNGTGVGVEEFCAGLVPVVGASRALSPAERAACRASGVPYARFVVARDAVILFTRTDPPATCLTLPQVYAAAGAPATGTTTWEEVARRSGTPVDGWLTGPVAVVGPPETSGTMTVFVDLALVPVADATGEPPGLRADYQTVSAEQGVRSAATARPGALGIAGYAVAADWRDDLRLAAVDAGAGCVSPTPANIASGAYPLSRPLEILVNLAWARRDPVVQAFVSGLLDPARAAQVRAVGGVAVGGRTAVRNGERWRTLLDGGAG
jgi:phosphate transport system substrate-binding protein